MRAHTREQDLTRTESFITTKGRGTKALSLLCIDVDHRGMRRDETVKLLSINHQQLGQRIQFLVWYLRNLEAIIPNLIGKKEREQENLK